MVSQSYKVCRHVEQRFMETFSVVLDHQGDTFEYDCDVYGNHRNLLIFCDRCIAGKFQQAEYLESCCCGHLPANKHCNFRDMIKYHLNIIVQKFSINQNVFLLLIKLDFMPLNNFWDNLDSHFFLLSHIYKKVLISLDNPECDFIMPVKVVENDILEELENT